MSVRGQIAFSMNNHTKLRMECCGRRETQETLVGLDGNETVER